LYTNNHSENAFAVDTNVFPIKVVLLCEVMVLKPMFSQ